MARIAKDRQNGECVGNMNVVAYVLIRLVAEVHGNASRLASTGWNDRGLGIRATDL
jgi:hypothetical protein